MGNLCGKSSKDSSFSTPGRTLGSAPPQDSDARTPIPNRATKPPPRVGGPDRTLGDASGGGADEGSDPRSAAARAAEARANNPQSKGSLGQKLADQKRQTGNQALTQASREERGARDQDANAEVRAYN